MSPATAEARANEAYRAAERAMRSWDRDPHNKRKRAIVLLAVDVLDDALAVCAEWNVEPGIVGRS